jgi:hypothetical protein
MQIIYKSPCERPGRSIEKLAVLVGGRVFTHSWKTLQKWRVLMNNIPFAYGFIGD